MATLAGNTALKQANIDKMNWGSISDNGENYSQIFTASAEGYGSYELKPSGNGVVDIAKNYTWTYSKYRTEVPRIKFVEKQIKNIQQLNFYANVIAAAGVSGFEGVLTSRWLAGSEGNSILANSNLPSLDDPYANLYNSARDTGFSYIFPHYEKNTINNGAKWSEKVPADADFLSSMAYAGGGALTAALTVGGAAAAGGATFGLGSIPGAIAGYEISQEIQKMAAGASAPGKTFIDHAARMKGLTGSAPNPYAGVEQPQYFSGGVKQDINISFPLFNTKSAVDVRKNYDFIRLFNYQNLLNRTSLATYEPPVIYLTEQAEGDDGAYANHIGVRMMYVSRFNVQNLGAVRAIKIGSDNRRLMVPEAYNVNITFTDLITNSRHLYASAMTGASIINFNSNSTPTKSNIDITIPKT